MGKGKLCVGVVLVFHFHALATRFSCERYPDTLSFARIRDACGDSLAVKRKDFLRTTKYLKKAPWARKKEGRLEAMCMRA